MTSGCARHSSGEQLLSKDVGKRARKKAETEEAALFGEAGADCDDAQEKDAQYDAPTGQAEPEEVDTSDDEEDFNGKDVDPSKAHEEFLFSITKDTFRYPRRFLIRHLNNLQRYDDIL